jgi:SAM-dependent methyltransferase
MYGLSLIQDVRRAVPAILTNQIARFAPGWYVRLTRETGRGGGEESVEDIASYFEACFADYFRVLEIDPGKVPDWLEGKRVLEYGPGDVPAVALLMLAHGAQEAICVDRFALVSLSAKNIGVLRRLIERLPAPARSRAEDCFQARGEPESGFREERLHYIVQPSGLSGLRDAADLVISRAVLEHVNDLSSTFEDLHAVLRADGIAVQKVDLRSHGLHRSNPLDFLTWPIWLWSLMYSGKGVPNRWRVDRYRRDLGEQALKVLHLAPTTLAEPRDVAAVRPHLAEPFRDLSDEDLSWLGFWLVCKRAPRD